MQVHAIGLSDHNNWVSIHRLSNKKAYTERVDYFPRDSMLSEIVNRFITSAILAAMISSAETQKVILKICLKIFAVEMLGKTG